MLLCSHSIAGKFPYPPKIENQMSEAKPQDGTTVKGYRTLIIMDKHDNGISGQLLSLTARCLRIR